MPRRAAHLVRMLLNGRESPSTLARRQERLLNSVVRHAASRVPFYRELYARHGVDVAGFRGLADLHRLPIVDKRALREAGPLALSDDPGKPGALISTSGSTGEPFVFPIDRSYDLWRKAQFLRPYIAGGRRVRDSVLRLTGHSTGREPWFSRLGLLRERRFHCGEPANRLVEFWRRHAPDVLMGYPSALRVLAHHCLESGRPLDPAPRIVFTDSELLTADTRELLARVFGTAPIDIYGTWETDNIAWECSEHAGYHIATDCVVLETVRDGVPCPPGTDGEIVVTVLRNRMSPMIRYNLRDIGSLGPTPCVCGLPFPMLSRIDGRTDDLIVLADGRRRSAMDISIRMRSYYRALRQYQLRQTAIGRFELTLVPGNEYSPDAGAGMLKVITSALGDVQCEIRIVDAIPAERSGKLRSFVSAIPR